MIELMGESLGKRQQELNIKVNETVKKKVNFDNIKETESKSDVDSLYKIDVASQYKNIDYIVEVLKCGDNLYISRALKRDWIYKDEYSHIMNPDYLHHKVFPHMSLKMKSKMINKIASHVRNESRMADFFTYCMNLKMKYLAQKFLYFTSVSFKLNVLNSGYEFEDKEYNLKNLIGSEFKLAEAFISRIEFDTAKEYYLHQLTYLYSVDEEQYLNLLEKTVKTKCGNLFGGRMSKSIMTKHKNRVLKSPLLYIHKLKKYMLVRHSTSEDAKKYIVALFPTELNRFWSKDFYGTYKYIFDLIPKREAFNFFKNTFHSLYGDTPFEMTREFYEFHYYELFTLEEREKWALKHIEEGKELLGNNKDYIWYKFVNYEHAFKAIKQYIQITSDEDDRNEMVMVLIHSAKNHKDLEKLFNYYYERHINESGHHKDDFIDCIVQKHNIFEFDEPCWTLLNKILYSMEVYTPGFYGRNHYRAFCVMYNIIHKIEMPDALTYYLDNDIDYYRLKIYSKQLQKEQWHNVFQYLFNYYLKKFQAVHGNEKEMKQKKIKFSFNIIHLLESFEKKKEDMPQVILEFVMEKIEKFKYLEMFKEKKLTDASLVRLLKQDKNQLIKKLPKLKDQLNDERIKITSLLKKIKVYFNNDIADNFLQFFYKCINNKSDIHDWNTRTAIYGIFLLGDEDCKKKLLSKYAPEEPKIDHSKIDRKLLDIQEAICRFACYSRPPVALNDIMKYIKGDYVHYCLPMFNMYSVNLPLPQSIDFITAILDAPLSIQKHGLRLAFKTYSTENLKILITNTWQKTKNVTLRLVIYKALFNKIKESNEKTQDELYEILKMFTLSLHADDQDEIFNLIVSNDIPERFRGNLLETAWTCIKKLSHKKSRNISIKTKIIEKIEKCIKLMNVDFCKNQIIHEHIDKMLAKKGIQQSLTSLEQELYDALWGLTAKYLLTCRDQSELNESLSLVKNIFQEAFNQWNYVSENNEYAVVKFCYDFVKKVKVRSFEDDYKDNIYVLPVMEQILKLIQELSPSSDVFILVLDIKLFIAMREIMLKNILDIEEVAILAAKSLINFVEHLKSNSQLIPSFFDTISTLSHSALRKLASLLCLNADLLTVYVCKELVISSHDNYITILALDIMPLDFSGNTTDRSQFQKIGSDFIKKIKDINNFEVQSYYFKKFIVNYFRKRF